MKYFIYGRIMGALQLLFWIVMIPWIILTIPIALYYEQSARVPPLWFENILSQSWIDWKFGLMIISTMFVFLFCIGIIWLGWQMSHPISEHNGPIPNVDRLALVQSFSKKKFLKDLHAEAKAFHNKKKH